MITLDDSNFILYAASNYDNPTCYDMEEFEDDLKRFKYLKRLFNKFKESGDFKDRLVLNHLIVLFNVFGHKATVRMLFFKLPEYHSEIKTILTYMGVMPDRIVGIKDKTIVDDEIEINRIILDILQNES